MPYSDSHATNRLRNTPDRAGTLVHNPHAILLRNAFVDTTNGVPLSVPSRLHASQNPGAFVVQVREGIPTDLHSLVAEVGGQIVSYIPNRSWLIIADDATADRLAAAPEVAAVLPYEPYFKLEPSLIPQALDESPVTGPLRLILTVPEPDKAKDALAQLGAQELHRERGPFGTLLTVEVSAKSLVALAQIPQVHLIETWHPMRLANDRTGIALGVYTNAENTGPYLGLTGKGVLVNLNDTGVDITHPDLQGRVTTVGGATNSLGSSLLTDPDGHGTHVAATIAGDGSASATLAATPQGSITNANFQGKAPAASIYILPIDLLGGPLQGDEYLQTVGAMAPGRTDKTEPLISNNSWGYFNYEYNSHSASFDAAVRDALPDLPGDQPTLYVFAAGNEGAGGENGLGGFEDSIRSPGNAKNVITVGALESARNLTNSIIQDTNGAFLAIGSTLFGTIDTNRTDYLTNYPFAASSDTDYEVANYSGRGNVGIGTEGDVGRFKPDVVAPGSFIISARSAQWDLVNDISTNNPVYFYTYKDLTNETAPHYRYENGTSMATPAVSGLLALMQEYFRESTNGPSPSAAGYKALLINGSLPTSDAYLADNAATLNLGGWGEPTLTRILQPGPIFSGATGKLAHVIESDDPAVPAPPNQKVRVPGLATGDARSFRLTLNSNLSLALVRLTLVWTDPPGNPAGAAKLVNDLDLVVSNEVSGKIFVGNHFEGTTGISTELTSTNEFRTNSNTIFDRINNVEKIIFDPAGGSNFVVSVIAHLVNVNARRDTTNAILQDFALAISADGDAGSGASSAVIESVDTTPILPGTAVPPAGILTNGMVLLEQRAGANSPLINDPNGQTNQWRFYVFTNIPGSTTAIGDFVLTNGSNIAFITFPVGDLSRSRTNEPDIDLYVSLNPALTNLDAVAIDSAFKSTSQGATEMVIFTNAPKSQTVYYIGVKSEDHEGVEYGFVGISTDQPFDSQQNGISAPFALPLTPYIPDGTPKKPGKGLYLAISTQTKRLRKLVATDTIRHQRFADLLGNLTHQGVYAVLNNHGQLGGLNSQTNPGVTTVYEDTRSQKFGKTRHTDGPGSLKNFIGQQASGPWFLSMVDNASGNTGRISNFKLGLVPNDFGDDFVSRCVAAYSDEVEFIQIPTDGVSLEVTVTNMAPPLPLEVYIQRDDIPDPTTPQTSDKYATLQPPGGTLSLTIHDSPPLVAGRYFILVHNPNGEEVCYKIRGHVVRNLDSKIVRTYRSGDVSQPLPDQARAFSSLLVNENRYVTDVQVGLRVDHPRESDLSIRLTDPAGISTVVIENRGGTDGTGFGKTTVHTNSTYSHVAFTYQSGGHLATLYVNGELVAEDIVPTYIPATDSAFYFHFDPKGSLGGDNFPLAVDDFGIWNRALPIEKIQNIYVSGLQGVGKDAQSMRDGLVTLWKFDAGGRDSVGTNHLRFAGGVGISPAQIANGARFASRDAFASTVRTPNLDVGTNAGFSMEGWVNVSTQPELIGGWGNNGYSIHPALLANYPPPLGNGLGSISVLLEGDAKYPELGLVVLKSPAGVNVAGAVTTNVQYALFDDDTETAGQLIKFAPTPFSSDTSATIISQSLFEADPPGIYVAPQLVDGWMVEGQVTQLRSSTDAYSGVGFVSLDQAGLSQELPVMNREVYTLSFAAKRSPWMTNGASQVIVLAGTNELGRFDLDVGWQTNVFHYISTNNSTVTLHVDPSPDYVGTNAAVWLDNLLLVDGGTGHYLPEEPLKPHFGASAYGQWSLEIEDGRAPIVGKLVNWQLTVTLAPTNPPAIRLTNGIPFQTNASGDSIQYFIVDVPPEANAVTNTLISLSGNPLRLLYDQVGLPDGTLPNDVTLLPFVTGSDSRVVDKVSLPILLPGQRYYLGVENWIPGQTNAFQIQVDFAIKVTPLEDGVPLTATNLDVGLIDYYSFDVAPGVLAAQFSVSNFPSDVNLVLSKGQPLPTKSAYQYASTNSGTVPEKIILDLTDQPVPISPGRWYLGVYATGVAAPTPVPYTIMASQITNAIVLENNLSRGGTSLNSTVSYYSFEVPPNASIAQFALQYLSDSADLYVRLNDIPILELGRYDAASEKTGTEDRFIAINSGTVPVPISGGTWYVAVVPKVSTPVNYVLTASYSTTDSGYTDLLDSIPLYSSLTPDHTNEIYRFTAPFSTGALLFELYGLTDEAHLLAAFGVVPAQSSNPWSNFRSPGTPEVIVLRTNENNPDLAGIYFLEVRSPGGNFPQYTVRAATRHNGLLDSGQPFTSSLGDPQPDGLPTSLTLNVVPGELYQLEYTLQLSLDPAQMHWTPIPPTVIAQDQVYTFILPPSPAAPGDPIFYRVVHLPQP